MLFLFRKSINHLKYYNLYIINSLKFKLMKYRRIELNKNYNILNEDYKKQDTNVC